MIGRGGRPGMEIDYLKLPRTSLVPWGGNRTAAVPNLLYRIVTCSSLRSVMNMCPGE